MWNSLWGREVDVSVFLLCWFAIYCCDKTLTRTCVGWEAFITSYRLESLIKEIRAEAATGAWKQELTQRPHRNAASWHALYGSLGLLS